MGEPLTMLGLAQKAGRLELGAEFAGASARARKARLMIISSDASDNTKSRSENFARAGNIELLTAPYTMYELGRAVGKRSAAVMAFTDAGLAASFVRALRERDPEKYGELLTQLEEKAAKLQARKRNTQRKSATGRRRNKHG